MPSATNLLLDIDYEHIADLKIAKRLDDYIWEEYKAGHISKNTAKKTRKRLNLTIKRLMFGEARRHSCSTCGKECDCGENSTTICLECSVCAGVADA